MKIRVLRGDELDDSLTAAWSAVQKASDEFVSPYLSPQLTAAVAAARDDVYVGVMEDGGRPVGFFPFQRNWAGVGRPVGGPFSSCQAFVVERDAQWNVPDLLRGCGLSAYEFTHQLASQAPFAAFVHTATGSPIMDLSAGYEAYEKKRFEIGGTQLKRTYRMIRKIAREHPGYRFVKHDPSPQALQKLVEWKSEQCRAKGSPDIFMAPWSAAVLERIHASQLPDFGGVLSAIYVNERLIAAELDIRSHAVWHRWICVYDPEFGDYSPGVILGVEMAKAAAKDGVHHLDMGKDMTFYKESFMTGTVPIVEGIAEVPSVVTAARRARRGFEAWVRESPFVGVARIPGRWIRAREHRSRFE